MQTVLTGATGLVGSAVLSHMLSLPASQISKIHILSRKPVPLAGNDSRVNIILHEDFSSYPNHVLEQFKDAKGIVWALGISVNDVSKECVHGAAAAADCIMIIFMRLANIRRLHTISRYPSCNHSYL